MLLMHLMYCVICIRSYKRKIRGAGYFKCRSLKRMGKSVGRCNRNAIAKHAVSDKRNATKIVKLLGKKVEKEMKEMYQLVQF